jgi:23S rRNA (uridine2552-2'-O)-methyltransferase
VYERKDRYYRQAKAEGLRSRAAFKLEDVARDLIRPGDRVVDLGAWPGGWLQVAARRVGAAGRVVGVDLRPIAPRSSEMQQTRKPSPRSGKHSAGPPM